ncbi:MAG: hypothetical protein BWX70_03329 [Verrucomicrobia bacterium ADurb.Bin070]|nr:MAG: hypothetical protein BWX70_03329 [Verrucomicrobia bacterium ADurb.Bin070]
MNHGDQGNTQPDAAGPVQRSQRGRVVRPRHRGAGPGGELRAARGRGGERGERAGERPDHDPDGPARRDVDGVLRRRPAQQGQQETGQQRDRHAQEPDPGRQGADRRQPERRRGDAGRGVQPRRGDGQRGLRRDLLRQHQGQRQEVQRPGADLQRLRRAGSQDERPLLHPVFGPLDQRVQHRPALDLADRLGTPRGLPALPARQQGRPGARTRQREHHHGER